MRAALIVGLLFSAAQSRADLIKLKNGGELRGQVQIDAASIKAGRIKVKTLSGVTVTVDRDQAEFVTRRPLKFEIYDLRAKATPDTAEAQWELAEWCAGKRLLKERRVHLERIVDLYPDHAEARKALGYSKVDGQWSTRDERMKARGLVKHGSRYITPEELELLKKSEAELERERAWYKKIHVWKRWLLGRHPGRSREALAELQKIADADAVAALSKNFRDDAKQLRMLYVVILKGMQGAKPALALAERSLFDDDYEMRYAALNGIGKEAYAQVTPYFARELTNGYNAVVCRAGIALGRMGDKRAVPHLIEALSTTHRYKVRVPDKSSIGFGSDGSFGSGGSALPPQIELMLRAGQLPNGVIVNNPGLNQLQRTKVITVRYTHNNAEVLAALEKLTGESFGYDKRTWRLWLARQKSIGKAAKSP